MEVVCGMVVDNNIYSLVFFKNAPCKTTEVLAVPQIQVHSGLPLGLNLEEQVLHGQAPLGAGHCDGEQVVAITTVFFQLLFIVIGEEKTGFLQRLHEETVQVVAEYVILNLVRVQELL